MAFDQGAVDFIAKSRDRQIIVSRLRPELALPKADLPRQEGLACGKLVLSTETNCNYWNQVDVGLTLGDINL